eukprot:CAMPEP_0170075920 /NCGR_PEP_ID=MMETSP0019_2-20121128/12982_1 /TAXON_ID=98059 /ORGANISM="Dinobryon sp., Strain UTEXLB2267" /LENGTH=88 /DNA_ID=CAMNT_0010287221 /DNA_START=473 /DNA_END=739 /DNA_ORIENTATION=+
MSAVFSSRWLRWSGDGVPRTSSMMFSCEFDTTKLWELGWSSILSTDKPPQLAPGKSGPLLRWSAQFSLIMPSSSAKMQPMDHMSTAAE